MASLTERLKKAWNVFSNSEEEEYRPYNSWSQVSSVRPDRPRLTRGNERSIINAIYNRLAVDVSQLTFKHVRVNEENVYTEDIDSGLNYCLTCSPNLDQTPTELIHDLVLKMFDEGCVALVPTNTTADPRFTDSYDITSLRAGRVKEWMPDRVKIDLYNEQTGHHQEVYCFKKNVAIIENPFYTVMNEPNSVLKRLINKLNQLDAIDEQSSAGKLDMIIQLPYVIKGEARKQQAENRRKDIEMQLAGSKYGIAYTDGTEHITQLNRSLDNNIMKQVEYLTNMLYGQLGITQKILDGTANEQELVNYEQNCLVVIATPIIEELNRKFLSKTARSQGQSVLYLKDPFKLIPISKLADLADKFTRNEIMSPNEMRQKVGLKPSGDPKANELRNRNINAKNGDSFANVGGDGQQSAQEPTE